ncbi:MAG TPA: tRNA pseudouridine(13) synthase TruD [Candidatus Thermoplasmatota archaeon]|nr:tRNA pseudouridine(13) synthase TruD [Candidatus Thermoplasmatota archaeon]
MKTPDFEHEIGIDTYCTNTPGIGGKLRVRIDDFHVTELFLFPPEKEKGNFTIAEVSCRNWENHTLVHEIANRLHVSQRRISFAGTKDKRAWTTQLMSFDHVSPVQLSDLSIKDVSIEHIYQSNVPVRIGDLQGNSFEIIIRNLQETVTTEQINALLSPFQRWGGFPNYYGIQRFGIIRPITHRVGHLIIQGDFEKAAMTYIAYPMASEHEETYKLREELEKTRNYSKAFHSYPDALNFEKAMLNKLIQNPTDFIGAFKELPKNLLLMFVNAYESFLFNKILSERIRRKIPIHQAIVGDIIFPVRKNSISTEIIPVTETNIDKVNVQISKKKAVVTGLLVGNDTVFANGEMGEIEHAVIDGQKIDPRDFIIPEIPFLSSSGTRRPLLALLPSLESTVLLDELTKEHQALMLRFELQKGCYATSLLREIMKSKEPRNY